MILEYPNGGLCGTLWESGNKAEILHNYFIENYKKFLDYDYNEEIIDIINSNKSDKHFCVFDEIYSGTNPEEAVVSATSFLKYLVKNKNISCLITTHFIKICKKLKSDVNFENFNMSSVIDTNKNLTYKYKIVKGISNIKGGIQVLRKLNYPKEIMNSLIK